MFINKGIIIIGGLLILKVYKSLKNVNIEKNKNFNLKTASNIKLIKKEIDEFDIQILKKLLEDAKTPCIMIKPINKEKKIYCKISKRTIELLIESKLNKVLFHLNLNTLTLNLNNQETDLNGLKYFLEKFNMIINLVEQKKAFGYPMDSKNDKL